MRAVHRRQKQCEVLRYIWVVRSGRIDSGGFCDPPPIMQHLISNCSLGCDGPLPGLFLMWLHGIRRACSNFTKDDSFLISAGGNDAAILQWTVSRS